jgi:hypothetical protein
MQQNIRSASKRTRQEWSCCRSTWTATIWCCFWARERAIRRWSFRTNRQSSPPWNYTLSTNTTANYRHTPTPTQSSHYRWWHSFSRTSTSSKTNDSLIGP